MKTGCYCEIDFGGLVIRLAICVLDGEITGVSFGALDADCVPDSGGVIGDARRQLAEYAIGARRAFDVPFKLSGTDFQMRVWNTLLGIPYGETRSYSEIARLAGNPAACRAAGGAIHRNPISIIVPCHRVIGANGNLTGFGGGLPIKEKLLRLEASASFAPQHSQRVPPDRPRPKP